MQQNYFLEIVLDKKDSSYMQGDSITGLIKIQNTEQPLILTDIEISFRQSQGITSGTLQHSHSLAKITNTHGKIEIAKNLQDFFNFQFDVPYNNTISQTQHTAHFLHLLTKSFTQTQEQRCNIKIIPSSEVQVFKSILQNHFALTLQAEYSSKQKLILEFRDRHEHPVTFITTHKKRGLLIETHHKRYTLPYEYLTDAKSAYCIEHICACISRLFEATQYYTMSTQKAIHHSPNT